MNHLYASFPDSVHRALGGTEVEVTRGELLQDIHAPVRKVWFPRTALVSALLPLDDGAQREAGLVGCEGAVGLDALWAPRTASASWIVLGTGVATCVNAERLRSALATDAEAREHVVAFVHALLAQAMIAAACNATHSAEERFARWLLLCADRVPDRVVAVTHDDAARMLGMSRSRVTLLARTLNSAGLVRSSRGEIRVLDREPLAAVCCGCYAAVRRVYERALPYVPDCSHSLASGAGFPSIGTVAGSPRAGRSRRRLSDRG